MIDLEIKPEVVTEFLKELTQLHSKYGIVVDGCGCCGSPYLKKAGPGQYAVARNTDISWEPNASPNS